MCKFLNKKKQKNTTKKHVHLFTIQAISRKQLSNKKINTGDMHINSAQLTLSMDFNNETETTL